MGFRAFWVAMLVCGMLLTQAALSFAATAGMVVTAQPGSWAMRAGKKVDLAVKSPVYSDDVLVTDASGKMQVLFDDDTTVSLGADTEVAVSDFVFGQEGKKPSFSAKMTHGVARFVTGKIVEQNRSGFSVTTPQATVGIRGTVFSVEAPKGTSETVVVGLKVNPAFPISVTNTVTGAVTAITTSGVGVTATPKGNNEFKAAGDQLSRSGATVRSTAAGKAAAQNGGMAGAVAVAGASSTAQAETGTVNTALSVAGAGALTGGGSTGSGGFNTGGSGGTPSTSSVIPPSVTPMPTPTPGPSGLTAVYSGGFNYSGGGGAFPGGQFTFNADLGTNKISGATMQINPGSGLITAAQVGDVPIVGGLFAIANFTITDANPVIASRVDNALMGGQLQNSNQDVIGSWSFKQGMWTTVHSGDLSGSKLP